MLYISVIPFWNPHVKPYKIKVHNYETNPAAVVEFLGISKKVVEKKFANLDKQCPGCQQKSGWGMVTLWVDSPWSGHITHPVSFHNHTNSVIHTTIPCLPTFPRVYNRFHRGFSVHMFSASLKALISSEKTINVLSLPFGYPTLMW